MSKWPWFEWSFSFGVELSWDELTSASSDGGECEGGEMTAVSNSRSSSSRDRGWDI